MEVFMMCLVMFVHTNLPWGGPLDPSGVPMSSLGDEILLAVYSHSRCASLYVSSYTRRVAKALLKMLWRMVNINKSVGL